MRTRKRVEAVETTENSEAVAYEAAEGAPDLKAKMAEVLENVKMVGDEVEVTYGEELFTPAPYHSFRVGPFWAKTHTRVGESRTEAIARLHAELEMAASEQREQRYRQYKAAVRTMYGDKAADAMFGTKR
jgi:hypothetical protein